MLVFTLAVSAFVTPSLIGGPRIKLMATLIYQQSMGLLNWPFGGAIAFVMLFTILALFVLTFRLSEVAHRPMNGFSRSLCAAAPHPAAPAQPIGCPAAVGLVFAATRGGAAQHPSAAGRH